MKTIDTLTKEDVNTFLKSKPVKIVLYTGGAVLTLIALTYVLRIVAGFISECKNLNSVIKG